MNDAIEAAKKSLRLKELLLKSYTVEVSDELSEAQGGMDVSLSMRSGISKRKMILDDNDKVIGIRYLYKCDLRLKNKPSNTNEPTIETDEDISHFTLTASFAVDYEMKLQLEEEAMSTFGKVNVGYHVWPFWRELVQSTCNRVGISPISLPFYNPPKHKK
ncbi:hypothetical protein D3879_14855 [Pseudomonas cavernicola]|uniref:Preprotein translocase subunit SecB n=1 Tax=Pseudomonas cavernicola TaxID=2320866 RepID=A0A418XEJ9_9PSED|nr:hypothetical protein [Pseudomonas cavernicola]RJG10956.1 hypothetical protein D3879_14855 [Pseudomonas cavernicola]